MLTFWWLGTLLEIPLQCSISSNFIPKSSDSKMSKLHWTIAEVCVLLIKYVILLEVLLKFGKIKKGAQELTLRTKSLKGWPQWFKVDTTLQPHMTHIGTMFIVLLVFRIQEICSQLTQLISVKDSSLMRINGNQLVQSSWRPKLEQLWWLVEMSYTQWVVSLVMKSRTISSSILFRPIHGSKSMLTTMISLLDSSISTLQ